ncbi:hypothetical protein G6F40_016650 [Rhizopus arrhizus]|nr:hypothetical protein G6F40_016650 [Rhizopus arrhizus]
MQQAISRAIAGTHAALEATLDNGFEEFDVIAAAPAALAEVRAAVGGARAGPPVAGRDVGEGSAGAGAAGLAG